MLDKKHGARRIGWLEPWAPYCAARVPCSFPVPAAGNLAIRKRKLLPDKSFRHELRPLSAPNRCEIPVKGPRTGISEAVSVDSSSDSRECTASFHHAPGEAENSGGLLAKAAEIPGGKR